MESDSFKNTTTVKNADGDLSGGVVRVVMRADDGLHVIRRAGFHDRAKNDDGEDVDYFGGQKYNEVLAQAAENVSSGYQFLPSRSRPAPSSATTLASPTPATRS